jgi:uncharacterized protein with HEPN domain
MNAIKAIERFVPSELDYEAFAKDEKTIRAVEREFEIIGDAVKRLPTSLTDKYPEIPWRSVGGMRDRLIHHYWETETDIIWKTIKESVPQLKKVIQKIIDNENKENQIIG